METGNFGPNSKGDIQMSEQQVISMDEAKQKLLALKNYLPNADEVICAFGRFLAGRLNPQLIPLGFLFACQMAINDLKKGVDGSGKPIQSDLVGYSPIIFEGLRMLIPNIAEAIFPAEFAAEVKASVEKIEKKMEEKTRSFVK